MYKKPILWPTSQNKSKLLPKCELVFSIFMVFLLRIWYLGFGAIVFWWNIAVLLVKNLIKKSRNNNVEGFFFYFSWCILDLTGWLPDFSYFFFASFTRSTSCPSSRSWLLMPFRVVCSGFWCFDRFFNKVLLLLMLF